MKTRVSKLDAARRQLHTAIGLIFACEDEISAHTLVGAASNIISNLVENGCAEKSWDQFAQEANELSPAEYFSCMRESQNFFKHARNDPNAELEFDASDTDSIAFFATLNLGELDIRLSNRESVFQLWYLASYAPDLDQETEPFKRAHSLFGDLRNLKRDSRQMIGSKILAEHEANGV